MINPWTYYIINDEMPDLGSSKDALRILFIFFVVTLVYFVPLTILLLVVIIPLLGFVWYIIIFFCGLIGYVFLTVWAIEHFMKKWDEKDKRKKMERKKNC